VNAEDTPVLDVEDRFSIAPEWVLDAAISDAAVRLCAVLLRFGQTSGARMPARSTLARRMHKKSTDAVDRAMRELVECGAVVVQHRFDGGQRLTNKYLVRTSRPRPEFFTESETPPPPTPSGSGIVAGDDSRSWAEEADRLIEHCDIGDWDGFVNQCQAPPPTRPTDRSLVPSLFARCDPVGGPGPELATSTSASGTDIGGCRPGHA
jgi:hypothetical protein